MTRFGLVIGVVVIACLTVVGCTSDPPYGLDSGERVHLTKGSGSVSCSYQDLLSKVESVLDYVLPYTKAKSSGIDAMVVLHNKLEDMGINTGFVAINVRGDKPFYTCIAVETTDRGLVFFTLVPESVGKSSNLDRSAYIQAVYLQKGQKIGLVEARFAQSNSYSWYQEYLERWYYVADFGEYLAEYERVVSKNKKQILSIKQSLDGIEDALEKARWQALFWSQREIAEFNRLVDAYNEKVERFNQSVWILNSQVDDYNAEVAECRKLSQKVQDVIVYVTEESLYTFPKILQPITPPSYPIISSPPRTGTYTHPSLVYPSLAEIDVMIRSVDVSYHHIPKPDRQSVKKFERYTEKNFLVTDFKLWW